MNGLERILVRLPNWLGDGVLARPLLFALRASFPHARIAGVAPPFLLDLISADATLDERHAWPAANGPAGLAATLRRWAPDAACVLPPSFSSAWWAWRTGARVRVGYRHEGRTPLLTHALRRLPRGDRHLSQEYLEIGRALGAEQATVPTLAPSAEGEAQAAGRLAGGARDPVGIAVLGPGATYGPAKRWPAERFAFVGRELLGRGLVPLVCGTAAERDVCETVAREIGAPARSLAGETQLAELTALCARARVAVCNDSGLAHLAAATGTPTVVVFGSTSSAWTAPMGSWVRVVQRAPVCSPCFQRTCAIGRVCLTGVSERLVAATCAELLEAAA